MKHTNDERPPSQGCGIFFLLVLGTLLATLLLVGIPVSQYIYENYFETRILHSSDSPQGTHQIKVSSKGHSSEILIEESATASQLQAVIMTDQLTSVDPEDVEIEWRNDGVAQITITGRRGRENLFLFDAAAEEEKLERMPYGTEWD